MKTIEKGRATEQLQRKRSKVRGEASVRGPGGSGRVGVGSSASTASPSSVLGQHGFALGRFGRYLAKEECSFAIVGSDRTFDIECPSEQARDKWVSALEILKAYLAALKVVRSLHLHRSRAPLPCINPIHVPLRSPGARWHTNWISFES